VNVGTGITRCSAAALAAGIVVALGAAAAPAAMASSQVTARFVDYAYGQPYVDSEVCGAQAAAKKFNVNLKLADASGDSVADELQVLNAAIQSHPQGLLVDPDDPTGLNAVLKQATGGGASLVTIDGELSKKIDSANIRSNYIQGGALAADALGAALHGTGTVAVEALNPSAVFNVQRVTGFLKELHKKYPKIKVLSTQYDNLNANTAARNVSAQLAANPTLGGIFAAQQTGGEGALSALKAAGKAGKVKLVSYDADPSQVAGLKNGDYLALVGQSPYEQGYQGIELLSKVIRKQVKPSALTYQQYSGSKLLTKANAGAASSKPFEYVAKCS
jgi:ribose transport system substrate-binding protein